MKAKHLLTTTIAIAGLSLCSCSDMVSLYNSPNSDLGTAGETMQGYVVSQYLVKTEASQTSKTLGTIAGGAVGAGAGQMLGGGSGRVVSSVGFGLLGAAAGRAITGSAASSRSQRLTIKAVNGKNYTVVQPIYKEIGIISEGTQGTLNLSYGGKSRFLPSGY